MMRDTGNQLLPRAEVIDEAIQFHSRGFARLSPAGLDFIRHADIRHIKGMKENYLRGWSYEHGYTCRFS